MGLTIYRPPFKRHELVPQSTISIAYRIYINDPVLNDNKVAFNRSVFTVGNLFSLPNVVNMSTIHIVSGEPGISCVCIKTLFCSIGNVPKRKVFRNKQVLGNIETQCNK